MSRERKIDGGDGDPPLAPPPTRRGNLGRWGDGEIYIFAQLNVFHINILPRQ
ncbi:MAG: hypothetical protein F6K48_01740 [Okeania sp. SIO3H1]|uniref:hypothetical protein n=1 Tax=Okeania sp. SIO1I7 TaxID=2607772 RepID=UPI0013C897C2|nr:hypothetical protein [Okeania sp. SIO1I7]NEN87707.1 hypothetical protein [Okeania sp. SIO3H1]NET24707.1 hypothetical protein [Okeania sp. SIO1I7]